MPPSRDSIIYYLHCKLFMKLRFFQLFGEKPFLDQNSRVLNKQQLY